MDTNKAITNVVGHFMSGHIFQIFILFLSLNCFGQTSFEIKGRLHLCYSPATKQVNLSNALVRIENIESPYQSKNVQVDSLGQFTFSNLMASKYRLWTVYTGVSDTIVDVARNLNNLTLCLDKAFRPIPEDTLNIFIKQAQKDIEENNLKYYKISYGLILEKRNHNKINNRLKHKFNFILESVNCLWVDDRKSFLEREKYVTYNKVSAEYLDNIYGKAWRRKIK
jgi:hypothetical protein